MLKKIVALLLVILLVTPTFPIVSVFASLSVSAQSAILIDAATGNIIYEKNARERRSMASTTKIMTAFIALTDFDIDSETVITDEMIAVEGTSLGLRAGDKISLHDLVRGMMLTSGNDAATAIAISLCGSVKKFASLMNDKAKELGMSDTSFVTPSGLDADDHFTTAYDMAILTREALKNNDFRDIVSSSNLCISFGDPKEEHTVYNHNRLLRSYEGAIGVKTGFTKKSGRCLVSAAERNGVTLIAVTLYDPDDWRDHKNMLDYGFANTSQIILNGETQVQNVVGGSKDTISAYVPNHELNIAGNIDRSQVQSVILMDRFAYAPIKKGDILGKIVYTYKDTEIYTADIIANEDASIVGENE